MAQQNRNYGSVPQEQYAPWDEHSTTEAQPLMQGQPGTGQHQHPEAPHSLDPRPKNWPRCRPIIHHDIAHEIPHHQQRFVRQAYIGWYFHVFALFFNWICLFGSLVKGGGGLSYFFYALIALVLGFPVSLWVYYLIYNAARKISTMYFCIWFIMFALQIGIDIFFAIGIVGYGTSGLFMMLQSFTDKQTVIGIMMLVSTAIWGLVAAYSVFLFNQGRIAYNHMGGHKAATKEFSQAAAHTAYDNRDVIVQVAKDNKDTIKQVAYENKDAIIQFAQENKGAIAKVAMDNKDVIYENKDAVAAILKDTSKTSHV